MNSVCCSLLLIESLICLRPRALAEPAFDLASVSIAHAELAAANRELLEGLTFSAEARTSIERECAAAALAVPCSRCT